MMSLEHLTNYELEEHLDLMLENMSKDTIKNSTAYPLVLQFVGKNYQRHLCLLEHRGLDQTVLSYRKHWKNVTGYDL